MMAAPDDSYQSIIAESYSQNAVRFLIVYPRCYGSLPALLWFLTRVVMVRFLKNYHKKLKNMIFFARHAYCKKTTTTTKKTTTTRGLGVAFAQHGYANPADGAGSMRRERGDSPIPTDPSKTDKTAPRSPANQKTV